MAPARHRKAQEGTMACQIIGRHLSNDMVHEALRNQLAHAWNYFSVLLFCTVECSKIFLRGLRNSGHGAAGNRAWFPVDWCM